MGKLSKPEKRGKRQLEDPPKRRVYKRPVTVYVHYKSMGGELLAFAVQTCTSGIDRLQFKARAQHSNIVEHFVSVELSKEARLIQLPSDIADGTREL